jgi:hypothetical protein
LKAGPAQDRDRVGCASTIPGRGSKTDAGSSDLQAKSTLPISHPDELLARVFGVVFAVAVVGLGMRSIGRSVLELVVREVRFSPRFLRHA